MRSWESLLDDSFSVVLNACGSGLLVKKTDEKKDKRKKKSCTSYCFHIFQEIFGMELLTSTL